MIDIKKLWEARKEANNIKVTLEEKSARFLEASSAAPSPKSIVVPPKRAKNTVKVEVPTPPIAETPLLVNDKVAHPATIVKKKIRPRTMGIMQVVEGYRKEEGGQATESLLAGRSQSLGGNRKFGGAAASRLKRAGYEKTSLRRGLEPPAFLGRGATEPFPVMGRRDFPSLNKRPRLPRSGAKVN